MGRLNESKSPNRYLVVKRVIDIFAVLLLLFPSVCVVSLCYIFIKLETKGPAFFVQERPGKHGRIFNLYKLRTMIVDTERNGRHLSDMERMTKVGCIIRKFSLDELPQIINVLKGEMSFIGPRPLLIEYAPYYTDRELRRQDVLPGITGWAQVNGRNCLGWNERLEKDVEYVEKISLVMDVLIFVFTLKKVLFRENIAVDTNAIEGNLKELRSKVI